MEKQYDDRGKAVLWKVTKGGDRAPYCSGHFFAPRDIKEGERMDLAFWLTEQKNDRSPVMDGRVNEVYKNEDTFAPEPEDAPPF